MKLRTVTGTRWPALCDCGCRTGIEPSTTTKVVVDFDARPRRTWIPEHAPRGDAGEKSPPPTEGIQPASALRSPTEAPPKAPEPPAQPKAPSPAPSDVASAARQGHVLPKDPGPSPSASSRSGGSCGLAHLGSVGAAEPSPNPQAGTTWATSQLTFAPAAYEPCKAGYADYARLGLTSPRGVDFLS